MLRELETETAGHEEQGEREAGEGGVDMGDEAVQVGQWSDWEDREEDNGGDGNEGEDLVGRVECFGLRLVLVYGFHGGLEGLTRLYWFDVLMPRPYTTAKDSTTAIEKPM